MENKFEKIIHFYTKYMAIWVVILSACAYFLPAPFIKMKPFMGMFFAVTMFGIGVTLHLDDFKHIFKNPMVVLIGTIAQFTIMPLGAFLVAYFFKLPPEIAVGLILTGSAPGAMASNVLSYIAKGDVAYSVSLTAVSTLLTPILTPTLVYLLAHSIIEISFWSMFLSVIQIVVIPLFMGICVRYFFDRHIVKILKIFPAISATFIIFICALVIALNRDHLIQITGAVILAVIVLNIGGMIMGYGVGKAAKFSVRRRRTLSIEIGMQNAGLGTVLALKHFSESTAIPTAAFVFICIFTASFMAEKWRESMDEGENSGK
jgi:bile acid:Na+ symporter, BASS family